MGTGISSNAHEKNEMVRVILMKEKLAIGKIVNTYPEADGKVRVYEVNTNTGPTEDQ